MRKVVVVLSILLASGLGFFAGHRYTAQECLAIGNFRDMERFDELLVEEIQKLKEAGPIGAGALWSQSMEVTMSGPMWDISVPDYTADGRRQEKYKKIIDIRKDISEKTIVWKNGEFAGYDIERLRPLAKEVARGIFEANKQLRK
jgi:hypothetical protein